MPNKVSISRLKLTDFRNYAAAALTLDGRHVVLTGDNGAGKTNLMEAVSLLSPGRGLRRAAYADVTRVNAPGGFSIFAELEGMDGSVEIGTGIDTMDESTARRLRINSTPAKTVDELTDHLRVLWLTPAMDGLFTGGSSERRRFLDRLVLSLDPAHGRRASDFERAMRSRNKLLSENRFDPSWLAGIEEQMASLGIAMAIARQEMLGLLSRLIAETRETTPFPSAALELSGFLDGQFDRPAVDLEDAYADMLRERRYRDAAAGRTLDGPHRADLLVRHCEKDMEAERCSTGEQKALLVGLILAHARLVGNLTGYAPILLLDEIAAHLDEGRRAALFDLIDGLGGQAFMTGTDKSMFSALGERAQFFTVAHGGITES
ncbi:MULTISPECIES: DNA replication/repair protein RecF [unclassified Rhizobium]|uniref:DNA replication/repair protein RecF n=1 Tax=unclassified Rhizobium TaxID=2613769 RepID=UPI00161F5158|nr:MULTISPECIES: DNA replication/repair protein RecF [unclassified Rhizobium]MBB3290733.1 DNA replication and repair protein RecF [Rhizobium sp. BK252]MBB3405513.1 DNA replication and repair protein RecF [Rhizobium sp. BK289]MBB3417984.1 DNA replication and repair protein RecF [Rhizobium sp. BK284]MBB3485939.1 DNA replication and repair protein RecF [Rhizobium sp. BK347]